MANIFASYRSSGLIYATLKFKSIYLTVNMVEGIPDTFVTKERFSTLSTFWVNRW